MPNGGTKSEKKGGNQHPAMQRGGVWGGQKEDTIFKKEGLEFQSFTLGWERN